MNACLKLPLFLLFLMVLLAPTIGLSDTSVHSTTQLYKIVKHDNLSTILFKLNYQRKLYGPNGLIADTLKLNPSLNYDSLLFPGQIIV